MQLITLSNLIRYQIYLIAFKHVDFILLKILGSRPGPGNSTRIVAIILLQYASQIDNSEKQRKVIQSV